jgi:hypothetical protein
MLVRVVVQGKSFFLVDSNFPEKRQLGIITMISVIDLRRIRV